MKRITSIVLAFFIILTTISFGTLSIFAQTTSTSNIIPTNADYADNRVIVVMKNSASLKFKDYTLNDFKEYGCQGISDLSTATAQKVKTAIQNISDHVLTRSPLADYSGVEIGKYNQIICLELEKAGKDNVLSIIEKLNERNDVLYASPDYKLTLATTTPEDALYDFQTYYENIQLPQAWDITTGSSSVYVGIIDCGIDNSHPDLGNNINEALSKDFSATSGTGRPLKDDVSHGTACAGVLAANTNNNMGISGICWNVKVVSLKIAETADEIFSSKAIAAINYAESMHIPIISMSLRWSEASNNMHLYDDPIYNAISNYSGLLVCSAGNESLNNDMNAAYPANYSLPNMITVGASTINDERAIYSNFGSTTVDIFAPGDVLTTVPLNWMRSHNTTHCTDEDHVEAVYHYLSGTSMATPMVAGVAALMLSVNPNLSARELKHIIIAEDDNIAALNNLCVSDGRLNAYKAVNHARYHSLNVSYSSTLHSFYCNGCGYTQPDPHEFYIANKLSGVYVVSCKYCPYSKTCNHVPQYSATNAEGHSVVCTNGCYSLVEPHNFTYTQTTNLFAHMAHCADCDYTYLEDHAWTNYGINYRCSKCLIITDSIPGIMQFPTDDELILSSMDDHNGVSEALLPERDDDFVTE